MPPRRAPRPSPRRDARRPSGPPPPGGGRLAGRTALALGLTLALALALAVAGGVAWTRDRPRRLRERAEAATLARDWPAAVEAWKECNRAGEASAGTWLAEARADLEMDRSAAADHAFAKALEAKPSLVEAWRGRLDRLRVLDRPLEALRLGRLAEAAVDADARPAILATTTLAALAELPDDEARARLDRWIAADPTDLDARVARLARIAANVHPGDPDRASRIAELAEILGREPEHVAAREALVVALGDAGEVDRGRVTLDAWPEAVRDARYDRLRGRWDLDYDRNPARAAGSFAKVLVELPHDWKSHYGLARAGRALGRDAEARAEADAVARLLERLAPVALGPRLVDDLAKLDDPAARLDLAGLCDGVGLAGLAQSWRREAQARAETRGPSPTDH